MGESGISPVKVGSLTVGPGHPVAVVAEISANHCRDYSRALEMIKAAKAAGADAVKVQTYTPDTMTIRSNRGECLHRTGSLWEGRSLYDLYQEAYMPWEWQPSLKQAAESMGLVFFSTAYDPTSARFLAELEVPAIKIASFELVDLPLIEQCAGFGKPLILSTGMATLAEVDEAVECARAAGAGGIVLLKCTSAYPAPDEDLRLRAIPELADRYRCPVGLSDHSSGLVAPVASVALGAGMIEKHFTLGKGEGLDAEFSLDPAAFAEMVQAVRRTEKSLSQGGLGVAESERQSLEFRRSLYIVKDLRAGEILTDQNVRAIRPGHGISPKFRKQVVGRRVTCDLVAGTPLRWEYMEGDPGSGDVLKP